MINGQMMSNITRILSAIDRSDPHAAKELLPLVYDELRKLASQKLAQEKPGQTLQATALVHEAYLRLVDNGTPQHWDGRRHFFAAAAEAMRRIPVDNVANLVREKLSYDFKQGRFANSEKANALLKRDPRKGWEFGYM